MTEPQPDRSETWEQFYLRMLKERDHVDIAYATAESWEMFDLRVRRDNTEFAIRTAERYIDDDLREG